MHRLRQRSGMQRSVAPATRNAMWHVRALLLAVVGFCGTDAAMAGSFTGFFGESGLTVSVATAMTPDGEFIIAYRGSRFRDKFSSLLKLDGDGSVLWERRITGTETGGPVHALAAAADGGLVVVGSITSNRLDSDAWVARLDATGRILWQRAFGGPRDDLATAVQATSDGGMVVVGRTDSWRFGEEILVLKLSARGELEWAKRLGTAGDESAADVRQIDGGYFVVGSQDGQGLALRLDDGGQVDWARRSGSSGFTALALSGNGQGFAAVSPPNLLTRVSDSGELLWQRSYSRYGRPIYQLTVAETGSGYLLGGSADYPWAAGVSDLGDVDWSMIFPALPGPPYTGPVRSMIGLPNGGLFFVGEASPITLAVRLDIPGSFPSCPWWEQGAAQAHDEIDSLFVSAAVSTSTPAGLMMRARHAHPPPVSASGLARGPFGLRPRETKLRATPVSPFWFYCSGG